MTGFSAEDRDALVAARFAEIKAVLQLDSVQEKHWPAVEATLHNVANARAARRTEVRHLRSRIAESGTPDVSGRLEAYAKGLRSRADQIDELANAAKPLLSSLDENQSRRFAAVLSRNRRRKIHGQRFERVTRHVGNLISRSRA